jgi:hypothetical protein
MRIDEELDAARQKMTQARLDMEEYSEGNLVKKELFNELFDALRAATTVYLELLNRRLAIKYARTSARAC